jgi:hypothetical protein
MARGGDRDGPGANSYGSARAVGEAKHAARALSWHRSSCSCTTCPAINRAGPTLTSLESNNPDQTASFRNSSRPFVLKWSACISVYRRLALWLPSRRSCRETSSFSRASGLRRSLLAKRAMRRGSNPSTLRKPQSVRPRPTCTAADHRNPRSSHGRPLRSFELASGHCASETGALRNQSACSRAHAPAQRSRWRMAMHGGVAGEGA